METRNEPGWERRAALFSDSATWRLPFSLTYRVTIEVGQSWQHRVL